MSPKFILIAIATTATILTTSCIAQQAAEKKALQAELKKQNLTATTYRILGYNGSRVPKNKRTWELQAILKK